MEKIKLNLWEGAQQYIQELMADEEGTIMYFGDVAKRLGCKVEEITGIEVYPDKKSYDEEGWTLEQFFPEKNPKFTEKVVNADYQVENFSIGYVEEVIYSDTVFVAEQNASPWGLWANSNKVEQV